MWGEQVSCDSVKIWCRVFRPQPIFASYTRVRVFFLRTSSVGSNSLYPRGPYTGHDKSGPYRCGFPLQATSGTIYHWPPFAIPLLREAWEARKVRLALLQEGVLSFLTLFGHVEEHGGVACQFLNTGKAIGVSIESCFEEADGNGAFL